MAIIEGGREAVTDFRVLERLNGATVLELSLRTGRTHQIRVHLASIGHPIIGDTVYGRAGSGARASRAPRDAAAAGASR